MTWRLPHGSQAGAVAGRRSRPQFGTANALAKRGEEMNLSEEELAFYAALAADESVVRAMDDQKLWVIAAELVTKVRSSVTIDWTLRESARANIRVAVRRIRRQYGYPPDLQDAAVQTVLLQAETLCQDWAAWRAGQ